LLIAGLMNQAPTKRIIPLFSSGKLDSSILQMDLINKSLQNFKSAGLMNQAPTNKSNLYIKNVDLINQINKLRKVWA